MASFSEQLKNRYGVERLYHFTDGSNLDSIEANGGILSLRQLKARGISPARPGGNQWSHDADKRYGLDKYVHLCFLDEHPMCYIATEDKRIIDPQWLVIDASMMDHSDVRFSADVANKSSVPILTHADASKQIDWEVLFTRTDWKDPAIQKRRKTAVKSEVLVPDHVPLDMIIGILKR